jgi:hypothetical protein
MRRVGRDRGELEGIAVGLLVISQVAARILELQNELSAIGAQVEAVRRIPCGLDGSRRSLLDTMP